MEDVYKTPFRGDTTGWHGRYRYTISEARYSPEHRDLVACITIDRTDTEPGVGTRYDRLEFVRVTRGKTALKSLWLPIGNRPEDLSIDHVADEKEAASTSSGACTVYADVEGRTHFRWDLGTGSPNGHELTRWAGEIVHCMDQRLRLFF